MIDLDKEDIIYGLLLTITVTVVLIMHACHLGH
jgi:hypothetical protein